MMILCYLRFFLFFVLATVASYAAYCLPPDGTPYAFAACGIGIIYGIFGIVGGFELEMGIVKGVVEDFLDFAPLGLMNIEIFTAAGESYAMVHALFLIPLLLDLVAKLFGEEDDDQATQTLKYIDILAGVSSLLYLCYAKENYMYAAVALSCLAAHSSMLIGGKCAAIWWEYAYLVFHSSFYFASTLALAK